MAVTFSMTFQPYGAAPAATIEVSAVSFDAEQTLNIGSQSTGVGAGKVSFNPVSFMKTPDSHSADFWLRMCSGTPFQKVTLNAVKDGAGTPFFSFTMGLVAIKTMSFSAGGADGSPLEVVTVMYGQAAYSVTPQNADGTWGEPVASGWDRVKNVAIDPAKVGTF